MTVTSTGPSSPGRLLAASALTALALLAGCAGLQKPFSQVDGHRYFRTPIDTYPVTIIRVDDRDTTDNPAFIEPGLRKIVVQGPRDAVHRFAEQRAIDLNVAPCVRYYLVAVKATSIAVDFSVKVDYEEPIAGCRATPST